jgi:Protein of unknown function (DUF5132)
MGWRGRRLSEGMTSSRRKQGSLGMDKLRNGQDDAHTDAAADEHHDHESENGGLNKTVATVVVVAAGAALFEAALLPGLVLGVAAMAAPKYLPKLAGALTPLFKSTVRGTFKLAQKSKEAFAEAHEHVNDIVAEVRAEDADGARTASKAQPAE